MCFVLLRVNCDSSKPSTSAPVPTYTATPYNDIQGLSSDQVTAHKSLYNGYVNKRNEIASSLSRTDLSTANATYSLFRELKVEETFAHNGALLHELYFENISGEHGAVAAHMNALLQKSFGSYENWLADFNACASCARGWVITAYSLDDELVHNFVLDTHNQYVPVLVLPLIVFDAYEHAYMIDFGINRKQYIERFLQNLNWAVVEGRTTRWIKMS
jgi:Fe-Mn family superoxide dismutase